MLKALHVLAIWVGVKRWAAVSVDWEARHASNGNEGWSGHCDGGRHSGPLMVLHGAAAHDVVTPIGQWGGCLNLTINVPRSVTDCLSRFQMGSIEQSACLEALAIMHSQEADP
jgi:hypothetical protein